MQLKKVDDDIGWNMFHPTITRIARKRFETGHFADSVEAAFKEINNTVKRIVISSCGKELDGATLMTSAFSPNQPIIRIGDMTTETGRNIQLGYMQIFSGAMIGIRNPKAHANVEIDISECIHLLTLASLLIYRIDERIGPV